MRWASFRGQDSAFMQLTGDFGRIHSPKCETQNASVLISGIIHIAQTPYDSGVEDIPISDP